MKKIIAIAIGMLFALTFIPGQQVETASAATSDTFDITVTGEYLWMEIDQSAWAIGVVEMSSIHYTNATDTFTAYVNDTTVNVDFNLQITSDAGTWSQGGAPAADTYTLDASIDTWSTENAITTAGTTAIKSGWDPSSPSETFDLRFSAPTSTSTGDEQSFTVTGTIVKS